jgi:hypothetical protein
MELPEVFTLNGKEHKKENLDTEGLHILHQITSLQFQINELLLKKQQLDMSLAGYTSALAKNIDFKEE